MIGWKIKTTDGPDGEVTVSKDDGALVDCFWDSRLAINPGGEGEYLAVYLTAKEARKIAKALLDSVVGVKTRT